MDCSTYLLYPANIDDWFVHLKDAGLRVETVEKRKSGAEEIRMQRRLCLLPKKIILRVTIKQLIVSSNVESDLADLLSEKEKQKEREEASEDEQRHQPAGGAHEIEMATLSISSSLIGDSRDDVDVEDEEVKTATSSSSAASASSSPTPTPKPPRSRSQSPQPGKERALSAAAANSSTPIRHKIAKLSDPLRNSVLLVRLAFFLRKWVFGFSQLFILLFFIAISIPFNLKGGQG